MLLGVSFLALAACSERGVELTSRADGSSTSETDEVAAEDSEGPEVGCGNGVIEADELCDDGNVVDTDGCSNECTPRACTLTWSRLIGPAVPSPVPGSGRDVWRIAGLPNGDVVTATLLQTDDLQIREWTDEGAVVWEVVEFVGDLQNGPQLLADPSGTVFVATDTGPVVVRALRGTDGVELWRSELEGWMSSIGISLARDEGWLYVLRGNEVGLTELDAGTGATGWVSNPAALFTIVSEPRTHRVLGLEAHGMPQAQNSSFVAWSPPNPDATGLDVDYADSRLLVFDVDGRLWGLGPAFGSDPLRIAEFDPQDGTQLQLLDATQFGLGPEPSRILVVDDRAAGGLVGVGADYVLALDGEMQVDCVAELDMDTTGVATAPDGGFYVTGVVDEQAQLLRFD